jgi:hypothetical protein
VIESMATRMAKIAQDGRMNEQERQAAKASLRQIAATSSSPVERSRAEEALAMIEPREIATTTAAISEDSAHIEAEAFLRLHPVIDSEAIRFLNWIGRASFLGIKDEEIALYLQRFSTDDLDDASRNDVAKRFRALRNTATNVLVWLQMMDTGDSEPTEDQSKIFALLGLDPHKKFGPRLAEAKKEYARVAAGKAE